MYGRPKLAEFATGEVELQSFDDMRDACRDVLRQVPGLHNLEVCSISALSRAFVHAGLRTLVIGSIDAGMLAALARLAPNLEHLASVDEVPAQLVGYV